MQTEILLSGTGGQGILVMGQLLAQAALNEDLNLVWLPSYGPETRGGTSDCSVILSSEEIGSPVICNPDILLAMHQVALNRYLPSLKPGGLLILNSSLVETPTCSDKYRIVEIAASDIAFELGDSRVANMVALGALLSAAEPVHMDSVKKALSEIIPERHKKLLPLNVQALERGMECLAAR
jgi:2-oxoglutarate ferredoxin oxidoreductase subunit gamma